MEASFIVSRELVVAAVRGTDRSGEYYVGTLALRDLPVASCQDIPSPQQRRWNDTVRRADALSLPYLGIVAFVDGTAVFTSLSDDDTGRRLGRLVILDASRIMILDLRHELYRAETPHREAGWQKNEQLPVVFVPDVGLRRFKDTVAHLKGHEDLPKTVLSAIHDRRFRAARIAEQVMARVPYFAGLTETRKSTISNHELYLALLKERCVRDGLELSDKELNRQFRLHLHRGIAQLATPHTVRSIADLVRHAVSRDG